MNRRHFLTLSAAASLAPLSAAAYSPEIYAPTTWRDLRDQNDRIVLNFRATWSLTCQMKQDILTDLVAENPDYQALTFVTVDWDTFGPSVWTERMKVERNSTLVALKNRKEIARVVATPFERDLRRFLDTALSA